MNLKRDIHYFSRIEIVSETCQLIIERIYKWLDFLWYIRLENNCFPCITSRFCFASFQFNFCTKHTLHFYSKLIILISCILPMTADSSHSSAMTSCTRNCGIFTSELSFTGSLLHFSSSSRVVLETENMYF